MLAGIYSKQFDLALLNIQKWIRGAVSNFSALWSQILKGLTSLTSTAACYTKFSKERMNEPLKSSTSTTYLISVHAGFPFIFSNFTFVFPYFLGIGQRQLFSLFPKLTWLWHYPCQSFKFPDFAYWSWWFSVSSFASSMWIYRKEDPKSVPICRSFGTPKILPRCTTMQRRWRMVANCLARTSAGTTCIGGILGKSTGNYFCRFSSWAYHGIHWT